MNFRPEPEGNKMTRREQHVKEKQYKICHTGYSEVLPGGGLPETGPRYMIKNPVMFVVEAGCLVTFF